MIGIRQKLMVGFGGLLAVVGVIGALTMEQIDGLGQAIDVILKENYRSVVACQDMKESMERIDSGLLFALAGNDLAGQRLVEHYVPAFRGALDIELNNLTLPGEQQRAERIKARFVEYVKSLPLVTDDAHPVEQRRIAYFSVLQPPFQDIQDIAQEILLMNQANMSHANDAARHMADVAYRRMALAIAASALLALLFSYLAHRWILDPINRLIESANEIRRGNLDLVVTPGAKDEIGRLAQAFNEMAAALRQVRKQDNINLIRTRNATEGVLKALPDATAVFDLDGRVQFATQRAQEHFGLTPGAMAAELGYHWLPELIANALRQGPLAEQPSPQGDVQQFIENREFFFEPVVVPIPARQEHGEPTGAVLILKDVTQLHEQQELKRSVVATVSHQLKTPLASLRMAVHLLLDERLGTLNDRQLDLLITARDDSERLMDILDELLDLNRIASGHSHLCIQPVAPQRLVRDAIEAALVEARDQGVTVTGDVAEELPEVLADPEKLRHVFANLFSNALRFTSPGGSITIRASQEPNHVLFSFEDTGSGIAPEDIVHLFEPFYRAAAQDEASGIGLGLAIVKEIVQAHGGDVSVASDIGKGSTFRFRLPRADGSHYTQRRARI